MKRPLVMRVAPLRIRESLFFRLYRRHVAAYEPLFARAELALAPGVFLQLSPADAGHQPIALAGVYETRLSRRVAALARRGGVMVDVGANYGYFTSLWAAARPANRVVAFEASPRNIRALRGNVMANRLAERVTIHEAAAGREPGVLGFRLGPDDQTGQGGFVGAGERAEVQVPVHTLDDLHAAGEIPDVVDVLKIDVEGADTWVLEGAERMLRARRIRHVFFEQFPQRMDALGIAPSRARTLLESCGYAVENFDADEWYAFAAG